MDMETDLVGLVIDGREVGVPAGSTVLEAAAEAGIHIPRLCHDRELAPFGACRLCVVEIEGAPGLPASCTTAVAPGMRVSTGTPRVVAARRIILELVVAGHPLECSACAQAGRCALAGYCRAYGVRESRFAGERRVYPVEDGNPFIVRDPNRCILCGKCVRACAEITGREVLDFAYRGFSTRVAGFGDAALLQSDCDFCGNCLAVCPTAALTARGQVPEKLVRTTCAFCGTGCNFHLGVRDGAVVGVVSDDEAPANGKALCVKGRFGWDVAYRPGRLTVPLVRRSGRLEEASWDEALDLVSRRLGGVRRERGGFAAIGSTRCTNEENYLLQRFARAVMGTNNVDHPAGSRYTGGGVMTNSIGEIREAGLLFLLGSNITASHPVIGYRVRQALRRGARLVVADPRRVELAGEADRWLRLKPGTDAFLINGLIHIVLAEGLYDAASVGPDTEEFAALARSVAPYVPEYVSGVTGVPAEDLVAVARLYAGTDRAMIIYGSGSSDQVYGAATVAAMVNLALVTGHLGRAGAGVNPVRGQNNAQGASDMGVLPGFYPGYRRVDDPEIRSRFAAAWGVALPETPGLGIPEMFAAAGRGEIRAMYILGANPVLSNPDAALVESGLAGLDFLVVQDLFLSETARRADVVLPGAGFAETDGTFTSIERRVQRVRAAVPPFCGRTNWQTITELCHRMGHTTGYTDAGAIFAEMASLTPLYAGITYDRLEKGGIQWPCPEPGHPGTPFLGLGQGNGGRRFFPVMDQAPPAGGEKRSVTPSGGGMALWPCDAAPACFAGVPAAGVREFPFR